MSDLERRLKAAETVCLLYGWSPVRRSTDREQALHQAWREWAGVVGDEFLSPKQHPDLDDEAITELAEQERRIRQRTLRTIEEHLVLPVDEFSP